MDKTDKDSDLDPYQSHIRDHFIFLLVVMTVFAVSDFLYKIVDAVTSNLISSLQNNLLGDFTYSLFIASFMMVLARVGSELIPEINLEIQPSLLDLLGSVFILTHPLRVYQASDGPKVRFDIITMSKNGEIVIFVVSYLFYIFAAFGVQQILSINPKRKETKLAHQFDILYSDILPITAILLAIIYTMLSILQSKYTEIDVSMMIKMIFYILFSIAALPTSGETPAKPSTA